ncbi:hypothetical protein [Paenibacillus phytorum]|uniref:hypothetical protein n=1 Tax=Paenibacillus phytorum TaxID=2654977 RepID=UPI001491FD22|nr:hypothetical protein [Paenibacillus phytorum]
MRYKKTSLHYHLMLIPGVLVLFVFSIVPMFGVVMAFQRFVPGKQIWKQEWNGLENFTYML